MIDEEERKQSRQKWLLFRGYCPIGKGDAPNGRSYRYLTDKK